MSETVQPSAPMERGVFVVRLAIGLCQGVILYVLTKQIRDNEILIAALYVAALLAPAVLLAEVGKMANRPLAMWFAVAAVVLGLLGAWAAWRAPGVFRFGLFSASGYVFVFGAALLFISHHLVSASLRAQRLIAPYPLYFDTAWSHALQVELSFLFLGIFWLVIVLGSALFKLIGQSFLADLIQKDWFWIPVSAAVFAAAVHLTDVQIGMVRGFRTVVLTLFSVLLPLMAVLSAAFLIVGAATGMRGVWTAQSATATLLGVAMALIVFLNAAYQDGAPERAPMLVIRWTMKVTPFLVLAMSLLSAYAVAVLVGRHGWTPSRVVAAAGAAVITAYGAGYAAAVLSPGRFLGRIEITNVLGGVLTALVGLVLLSPIGDPARLSVASQVQALLAGKIKPQAFDWDFLARRSARFGRDALAALEHSPDAVIALDAKNAPVGSAEPSSDRRYVLSRIAVYPGPSPLPGSVVDSLKGVERNYALPDCLYGQAACTAYVQDVNGDGRPDVVIAQGLQVAVFLATPSNTWTTYTGACQGAEAALKAGAPKPTPREMQDLRLGKGLVSLSRPVQQATDCG